MRKIKIQVAILILVVMGGTNNLNAKSGAENEVDKRTYLYAVKGADSLWMDKYELRKSEQEHCSDTDIVATPNGKPAIIFMFGGGFAAGNRDKQSYTPYFHYMAERGYVVVSIDYRLGFKGVKVSKQTTPFEMMGGLVNAIVFAVEDLYSATRLVIEKAEEWNIDKAKIGVVGSSAGAIAILQGVYELENRTMLSRSMPENFRYAGVISFAGAIMSGGGLKIERQFPPMMLFHGDADMNVPYNKLEIEGGAIGLYGSKYIAEKLEAVDSPYWFWAKENAAHELADTPMNENREEIIAFLDRFVKTPGQYKINSQVVEIGAKERSKDFTITDYIKANFTPQTAVE